MAYRAKKKSIGTKIIIWICLLAMLLSTASVLIFNIFA